MFFIGYLLATAVAVILVAVVVLNIGSGGGSFCMVITRWITFRNQDPHVLSYICLPSFPLKPKTDNHQLNLSIGNAFNDTYFSI